MNGYGEKLLTYFITLVMVLSFIFFAIRLAPGDPVARMLGDGATPEEIAKVRSDLGLQQPIASQYFQYWKNIVHLDFGTSLSKHRPVFDLVTTRIIPTITIAVLAVLFAVCWGVPSGLMLAYFKGHIIDYGGRLISLVILSMPVFSLAPLLVLFFSIKLNLLPISEWGGWRHVVLPVLTLTLPLGAILLRVTRNKFLEESHALWVEVLKSKGLSELAIVWRNLVVCLPTILTVVGVQLSVVLAGTMITEMIFDIPGMGSLLLSSIQSRDYPVVQGVVLYSTFIYLIVYFIIDMLNVYIDPRLKRNYE